MLTRTLPGGGKIPMLGLGTFDLRGDRRLQSVAAAIDLCDWELSDVQMQQIVGIEKVQGVIDWWPGNSDEDA